MEQLSNKACKSNRKRRKPDDQLNASFQGVTRLFVIPYFVGAGNNADQEAGIKDNKKYFLQRGKIKNYNVLIDGRNFHDQQINDLIKQYDELRKV